MNLSGKKLTTAILAGLMGATMFGSSVFAEVTDQEFNEVRQGVNSNTQRISQLESAQSAAKDYSKDIAANTTAITNEATARTDADTKLDTRITNVKEYLENQTAANYVSKTDAAVQDGAVVKAGNSIGENVTNLDGALAKETAARIGADAAQDKVIKQVNDNLVSSVDTINKNIGTITDQLNKNDLAEAQARDAADQTLQKNIDAEATARDQAVAQERADRKGADAAQDKVISALNKNVTDGFNTINQNIGTITDQLNKNDLAEAQARDAADQTLQKNIDAETTARQTDVANLQKNITDSLTNQGKINETLTTAVQNNSKAIVDSAKNLEKHLTETDGRVDKANAEIHTNAGNIAQNKQDIADIQNTLSSAGAIASADATNAANKAANDATAAAKNANDVADGLKDRVNLISNNQNVTSESDLIKKDQSIGQNLTNVDTALHKEIAARIGADAAQDKVIKQVNDNLVSSVNTINKNVADGFNALSAVDLQEAQTRAAADKTLQDNIDAEATTRDAADQKLQKNIDAEATARDQAVAQERAERKGADAAQDKVIKQVNDNLVSSVNTINKNVADGFNALSAVDLQEAQTRAAADQTLQNQIANNAQAIGTTKDGNYVKSNNSVGQNMNVLDAQVGQNSANINQLFSDYSSMKTDINKVGARSAALAGLHPLDFDPANKLNFAVASGSFKGENSVALGAFYRPNENVMFSAASTMGDSDNAYTFGLSFKIGPSSAKTKTTSPDAEELYKVVGQLQDQLAAQQKEIEQLKAEKAAK